MGLKLNPTAKEFLMTLAATTISIVLTFGTNSIVDRKKQNAAKREIVMMIMYDMQTSLDQIKECDEGLHNFVKLQTEMIANPQKYYENYTQLLVNVPVLNYITTTESIFKSNIETINIIGNVFFVETASSFYDVRSQYKSNVADDFFEKASIAIDDYDELFEFQSTSYPNTSRLLYLRMKRDFEQCRTMMKVTDEELAAFCARKEDMLESAVRDKALDETEEAFKEKRQMDLEMQKAREQNKKANQ